MGQTVEFVKAKIKDEWERLDVGADAPVEVRMSCRTRPSSERRPGHTRPPPKMRPPVPQGFKLVFDGTDMLDPMSLSDVAGIEAGKTVSIIMQRK